MKQNVDRRIDSGARPPKWLVATLALGCALAGIPGAQAQTLTPPSTPAIITPPPGNSAFLVGNAIGTQGYVCVPITPGSNTTSWTLKAARPEATLSLEFGGQTFQIVTHFLSPNENPNDAAVKPIPFGNATWQSSFDTSRVWAQVLNNASIPAGSHSSCPNNNSIPCLLLTAVGSQPGPTGGNILTKTTFVQRLNTKGGLAPETGCFGAPDVGNQVLVPYSADYIFYTRQK